jgi:hypothetical protein
MLIFTEHVRGYLSWQTSLLQRLSRVCLKSAVVDSHQRPYDPLYLGFLMVAGFHFKIYVGTLFRNFGA